MRTWLHRTAWLILLIALAIAAVRLAVAAGPMETGWETIASAFRGAALGWTGWKHTPISNREPPEQAEYWIGEVDRILARYPESAELCMGAAWVLDSAGTGFYAKYMTQKDLGFGILVPDLDYDAIQTLSSQFETECCNRCLHLAKRATELEPDDIRWWRMRALLLFVEYPTALTAVPRETAWREVLDECSQHDPDNALYDYLAARTLWNESAEFDWITGEDGESVAEIKINDEAGFEEGIHRIEAGQKKSFLAIGEAGYPAITEFLPLSGLTRTSQAEVAAHRLVTGRLILLFSGLWRCLEDLGDNAEQHGDKVGQITELRQRLRLFEQAVAPEEASAMNCARLFSGSTPCLLVELRRLTESHPDLIQKNEIDRFIVQTRADLVAAFVLKKTISDMEKSRFAQQEAAFNQVVVAMDAIMLAALSLFLTGVFFLMASLLDRQAQVTASLGFVRHAVAWTLGIALSVVAFGLLPAEVISPKVQTIVATVSAWAVVLTVVGYVLWKAVWFGRQRRFQYRILTLLGCMVAVVIFAWIWPVLAATASWLHGLPLQFHVPARGWSGLDAATLQASPQLGGDKWRWVLLQWNTYAGPYLAIVISLVLVTIWSLRYQAKRTGQTVLRYWSSRDRTRWSGLLRCLGSSVLTAGLCALLICLWLAPVALRMAESQFQYRMRYCRNPADQIAHIHQARAKVLASRDDMAAIRAEVEACFVQARNEIAISNEDGK